MTNLQKLQKWVSEQANGEWEHSFGVKIETLDNPGWSLVIDLTDTKYEDLTTAEVSIVDEEFWFQYYISNSTFKAYGDLSQLDFLIGKFLELINY